MGWHRVCYCNIELPALLSCGIPSAAELWSVAPTHARATYCMPKRPTRVLVKSHDLSNNIQELQRFGLARKYRHRTGSVQREHHSRGVCVWVIGDCRKIRNQNLEEMEDVKSEKKKNKKKKKKKKLLADDLVNTYALWLPFRKAAVWGTQLTSVERVLQYWGFRGCNFWGPKMPIKTAFSKPHNGLQ